MAASGRKLIIGLDFGTTFSGVAYCETDSKGSARDVTQIQLVTNWPGVGLGNTEKVPSRISYGTAPKNEIKWGNLVTHKTKEVHALMKLRLDERTNKSKQIRMLLAFLTGNFGSLNIDDLDSDQEEDAPPEYPGKDAVDIVGDYLTYVREHVWKDLESQYGEALLSSMEKEVVVTVPAVWSERAKDQTLKAVIEAKFPAAKLMMVTEPEAAAIYSLKEMQEGAKRDDVQVGDNFVLCDAGGGTVDLISYTITQIQPVFEIEEAAIGSGDKCGATYVDKEFLSWLERWIGKDAYELIPAEKTRHGSQMMNAFEMVKHTFMGDDSDNEIRLPRECGIEDDEERNIDDQVLTLDAEQMREIFDPCINRTLELIDGQIASVLRKGRNKPKMVIIVGGFGKNPYLFKKITEYCIQRGIVARKPTFPWSAVARGAVCRGLEGPLTGLVAVRLARKHYGTPVCTPYKPGIHNAADMYVDEFTGSKYAKGQMRWIVDKGERLPESSPKKVSIECSCTFKKSEDREFGAILVGCDADAAPARYAHETAYNICRVRADLSTVPESKFARARSGLGAEEFLIAEFKLQATLCGGNIDWKFIFDGKEYGTVSVSYDK
ncbi:actin-like ATPase domain-containing protein [Lindgomyces ingoldianus]|uniref:Actin-like ATPase domain-containing protein n=1 Tax=Lindgomyces ingoldianus TaxID=673940 RepID=A0ACB6QBV8_9PLEO|nr:actin-like ATPase domain-containing protein [Lindgomyces ingoldianus]KAF2463990.1 actin-like ATPase domain-containing protein [Lindgomyces ingoldianus]